MKHYTNALWCILGILLIFMALITTSHNQVKAETGGYPHWDAYEYNISTYDWRVDENSDGDYIDGSPIYEWYSNRMYWYRNCTDYVAWKLESYGVSTSLTRNNGDGNDWDDNQPTLVHSDPEPGDAAVKDDGTYGHISFVEAVYQDGTIKISEYNKEEDGNYGTRVGTPASLEIDHFLDFGVEFDDVFSPDPSTIKDDIFQADGSVNSWRLSTNATGGWTSLKSSTAMINSLMIGDFDGDGEEDDIFQADGTAASWRASLNGTGAWTSKKSSTSHKNTLFVGDFDADGFNDDIFQADGGAYCWRVSLNGTGSWTTLKASTATKSTLLIGDFDQDGEEDDIFQADGGAYSWRVSYNGTDSWVSLKSSTATVDTLFVGDFDGDTFKDDILQADGSANSFRVSINGTTQWQSFKPSTATKDTLLIGDFQ